MMNGGYIMLSQEAGEVFAAYPVVPFRQSECSQVPALNPPQHSYLTYPTKLGGYSGGNVLRTPLRHLLLNISCIFHIHGLIHPFDFIGTVSTYVIPVAFSTLVADAFILTKVAHTVINTQRENINKISQ